MRTFLFYLFTTFILINSCLNVMAQSNRNVLLFTKTTGFRHASIPKGIMVVDSLLRKNGINVFHTEDSKYFCTDFLDEYDAILFLNTTGDLFTVDQKKSLQHFIQSGKGFVGIHAASDTEHSWPWYGQLVGDYFFSHPEIQDAEIHVLDRKHRSTKHLQQIWFHKDEWYDFKNLKPGLNVLMSLNEDSYEGGKMGKFHPIAWFHEFDGGRSFYTGLGHTDESYDSENFRKHLLGGVLYVLEGDK